MSYLAQQFSQIYWREPLWLLIGLQPVLVSLLRLSLQKRQYHQFADKQLLPWIIIQANQTNQHNILHKIFSKDSAYILAWLLFALAAAGPRVVVEISGEKLVNNADIMLVVDVSRSMQVNDVSPTRIRRAQIEISELLARSYGNRIGLIVFAARPHLYVPLTSDYSALRFYLKSLDALILPTMGSQPASALKLAHHELLASQENSEKPHQSKSAIILITDGDWSHTSPADNERLKDISVVLNQASISVNILGVATKEGGAIPLTRGFDETGWLRYKGQSIVSRMDDTKLQQLAIATGGRYSPVLNSDRDWIALYDESILSKRTSDGNNIPEENIIWHELYSWLLAPAILFMWIAIIPYGLKTGMKSFLRQNTNSIIVLFTLSLMLIFVPLRQANANSNATEEEKQAYRAYINKDYRTALGLYKNTAGYSGRMGEGSSYYQLGNYKGAIQQFTQAVLDAENEAARATGLYNLGNSYFNLGDYRSAVRVFKDTLIYHPEHIASRHNLAFSEALMKAIDTRLMISEKNNNTGAGPSRSDIDNGLEVSEQSSISVDDSQEALAPAPAPASPLPKLPDLSKTMLQRLINKGLRYIKFADENNDNHAYSETRLRALALGNARIRMKELEDQQPLLWKRMFEIEEGFPAPQDKPSEVPGVLPW